MWSATPAWAQFGPPQPRAEAFDWSLGFGVHNVSSEWRPYDHDINRNRIYVEGSYAFHPQLEAFARAGGSDFVVNDMATWDRGHERDVSSDGYPAFFSGGLRGMFGEYGRWSLGAAAEFASYAGQERAIRWDWDVYQELHFESTFEMNFGLSLGCRVGSTMLYSGPLLHYGYTRVDVRTHEFGDEWEVEDTIQAETIRDKAGLGFFFGLDRELGQAGWRIQLEGAGLRNGMGGALGIYRRY